MKQTKIAQAVAVLAGLFCVSGAFASGFQLLEQNASGLGNAYAGSAAVADNASTIFYNPAGMTQLQAHAVSLGGNLVQPSFKFTNNGSNVSTPFGPLGGNNGGDAGGLSLVPNAYFSMPVTKDWYFGLGVDSPFGLKTQYDPNWVGRFQSINFDITTSNVNPSVAWHVNDTVSLGFGLDWQHMNAIYERMAATASPSPFLPPSTWPALQNTRLRLDVNSDAWGWNTGALFNISPSTKVGLSYRSAIKHKLTGMLTSNNQLISPDSFAKADIKLPDTAIMSVTQKLDDNWEMLGDLSWTGWHKIQNVPITLTSGPGAGQVAQTLNADFRNTWRIALGANYKVNEAWKLKYGVAYDQSPVRGADERLVALPDNNRIWLSLGTQWQMSKTATVDVGAAYIWIRDTQIDNDETSTGQGRVTGTYKGSVSLLGVQYSQSF